VSGVPNMDHMDIYQLPGFRRSDDEYDLEILSDLQVHQYFKINHAREWHPLHYILSPNATTVQAFLDNLKTIAKLQRPPGAYAKSLMRYLLNDNNGKVLMTEAITALEMHRAAVENQMVFSKIQAQFSKDALKGISASADGRSASATSFNTQPSMSPQKPGSSTALPSTTTTIDLGATDDQPQPKKSYVCLSPTLHGASSAASCCTPPYAGSSESSPELSTISPPSPPLFTLDNKAAEQEADSFFTNAGTTQDILFNSLQEGKSIPSWAKNRPLYTFKLHFKEDWGPRVTSLYEAAKTKSILDHTRVDEIALLSGIVHLNQKHIGFSQSEISKISGEVLNMFYSKEMEDADMRRA
ncbi:hypothetical protein BGZ79_004153, partial [Entomortierella chlamydospora]